MKVTPIVKRVLRDNPGTRNSDRELLLVVWEEMGFYLSENQRAKFKDLPSTETIRRIRQKLQEGGEFVATNKVAQVRRFKSYEVQQNVPEAKPERLEHLIEQRGLFS